MAGPSRLGSMSSTSSTINNGTQSLSDANPTSNADSATKNYALEVFLGRGYDKTKNPKQKVLTKISQNLTPKAVSLSEAGFEEASFLGSDRTVVVEQLSKKFSLGFDVSFPSTSLGTFSLGGSGSYQTSKETILQTEKITFATTHIKWVKCSLSEAPVLIPLYDIPKGCSHLVKSGWAYTGYKIFIEITAQFEQGATGSDTQVGGNLGLKYLNTACSMASLKNDLKNKTIAAIQVHGEGYVNYELPKISIPEPLDVKSLEAAIKNIHAVYIAAVKNGISTQRCVINEDDDLQECSEIAVQKTAPPSTPLPNISAPAEPASDISSKPLIFSDLAIDIREKLGNTYIENILRTQDGKQLKLVDFLMALETTFSHIFLNKWDRNSLQKSHLYFIGNSRIGKSTLIAHLMGGNIVPERVELSKGLMKKVYVNKSNPMHYPEIGHEESKTKGYEVWKRYIDTAGLNDTEGLEAQICNSMAISMATRIFPVKGLAIVLDGSYFKNNALPLLQMIETLQKVIPDLLDSKVMSQVLFFVKGASEKKVKDGIDTAILMYEKEKEKKVNAYGGFFSRVRGFFDGLSGFDESKKEEEQLRKLEEEHPEEYATYSELEDKIKILSKIKERIVLIDYKSNNTRKMAKDLKQIGDSLPPNSLQMQNLVYGGDLAFKNIIAATVTYFNIMFNQKQTLENALKRTRDNYEREKNSRA